MSGNKNNLPHTPGHMKAAVYYKYGSPDGISIARVANPAP
jgi:hypothetical protein